MLTRTTGTLSGELRAQGKLVAGEELQPVATATTVQVRDGETVVSDGPFAETKEVLGGYYLIEAESLDEAIEWAAKVPSTRERARSRSGRSSTTAEPAHRRRRPCLPRRACALHRDPRPRPRRSRPRRGRGAGRLRDGGRSAGRATARRESRRLDRHDCAQPRDRPHPPRADARAQDRAARASRAAPGRRGADDSRRAARADLRLLPPGARRRGAGRADAEPASAA